MTSKPDEGFFAGREKVVNHPPDHMADSSEERAILKKIREVSMNSKDFDEMVQQYPDQDG